MTKEEMFEQNKNLAYSIVKKYNPTDIYDLEDIKQVALLGLWKAVLKYDNKHTFSSFAYVVIENEIKYALRTNSKENKKVCVSINQPFTASDYNSDFRMLENILVDKAADIDVLEDKLFVEEIGKIISTQLNKLKDYEYEAYKLWLAGKTQKQIAMQLNITQPAVSRILQKLMNRIKNQYFKEAGQ